MRAIQTILVMGCLLGMTACGAASSKYSDYWNRYDDTATSEQRGKASADFGACAEDDLINFSCD